MTREFSYHIVEVIVTTSFGPKYLMTSFFIWRYHGKLRWIYRRVLLSWNKNGSWIYSDSNWWSTISTPERLCWVSSPSKLYWILPAILRVHSWMRLPWVHLLALPQWRHMLCGILKIEIISLRNMTDPLTHSNRSAIHSSRMRLSRLRNNAKP